MLDEQFLIHKTGKLFPLCRKHRSQNVRTMDKTREAKVARLPKINKRFAFYYPSHLIIVSAQYLVSFLSWKYRVYLDTFADIFFYIKITRKSTQTVFFCRHFFLSCLYQMFQSSLLLVRTLILLFPMQSVNKFQTKSRLNWSINSQ